MLCVKHTKEVVHDTDCFVCTYEAMKLQNDVLKRIADAASKVVRGCARKIEPNPGGMCCCDDCTHLSVCLGAYFRPEPEVEKAWFERRGMKA